MVCKAKNKNPKTERNYAKENKLFAKYGHECALSDLPDNFDWAFVPGTNFWAKFRRFLIRLVVVSTASKFYTHHLRSFGAILKERNRQLNKYPFTIHPFSVGRIVWAIIMVVVIIFHLILAPFQYIMFSYEFKFQFTVIWMIFKVVLNSFLYLNIMINFITGYYDEPMQLVVLNYKGICRHYLKTTFILDCLSAIPTIHFQLEPELMSIMLWLSLFRFFLIVRFANFTKVIVEFYDINYCNYRTTLVIFYMLLYWHSVSCIVSFIRSNILHFTTRTAGIYDLDSENMSSIIQDEKEQNMWTRYVAALEHTSLLLYNSNYGRTYPFSEGEIVLNCAVWYASNVFCIFILAMIMEINIAKTSSAHKYDEMEGQLKEYMRHKQLPTYMRNRILTYYEFKFQKRYFKENEILSTISEQLRQEMNMHACRKLVENVIFFRNLPLNLLVRIISCLKIEVFLVNDIIIRANTPGASMYFISTGTVAIYTKSGKEVCHLEDGAHFGEVALLIKDTFRIASVIAVEVSEIYRLDQQDFVKAISPYPDLLANIQHIAEDRMEVSSMLDEYNKREMATKMFQ